MAENTSIPYCDHTANAWRGCCERHIGCQNCYARRWAKRNPAVFGIWGPNGERVIAKPSLYDQVAKWDRRAAEAGKPEIVFWNDMSDTFEDRPDLVAPRRQMFSRGIDGNRHLIHLLVTKRPENVRMMWPQRKSAVVAGGSPDARPNVWLLYSASDQETLDAGLPHLLACRDLVAVLGLSLEPLVGPVDLRAVFRTRPCDDPMCDHQIRGCHNQIHDRAAVDWVIVGGESGPNARLCGLEWVRSVRDQCAAGVAFFCKQWGANAYEGGREARLRDPKGADPSEWPKDMRVRQWPEVKGR